MEKIGQYISNYSKGKVPDELFDELKDGTQPYLSPDYLRGKTAPEFYAFPSKSTVQVDKNEVIVLWDGSNAGEIFISKKGILASTMVKLEFDEEEIYKPYYSYSFQYLEYFLKAKTAGSGIPHVDKGVIKRLYFFKPPKSEQIAIAAILSKVDEAIEATQNSINAAENLKKSLMQNLLSGKLKPDGSSRKENEFYMVEKFGKVPKDWMLKTIDECFVFYPTASYSRSMLTEAGDCNYIHYGDIHTKFQDFIDCENDKLPCISNEMANRFTRLKTGDLVISDASEDYEGVAKAIEIINKTDKIVISGLHTLHLRDRDNSFIDGFRVYILSHPMVRNLMLRSATGIKVYSVSKNGLKKIKIPVPPVPEQNFIKSKFNAVNFEINSKQTKIQTLQRLKKALMQNLLTGKVRIKPELIKQLTNG